MPAASAASCSPTRPSMREPSESASGQEARTGSGGWVAGCARGFEIAAPATAGVSAASRIAVANPLVSPPLDVHFGDLEIRTTDVLDPDRLGQDRLGQLDRRVDGAP